VCTVTALPRSLLSRSSHREPLLLRVACNRDERRARVEGLPPERWIVGARQVLMPIDPQSGGTWIAANDAGVVFVVLNSNSGRAQPPGDISRGTIVPAIVEAATVSDALTRVQTLEAQRYAPFRLLLFDRYQLVECWRAGGRIRHRRSFLSSAIMRTSSSLGDAVVSGPRRALFQRFFSDPDDPCAAQDGFHQHRWLGREDISVNMLRADACTVSHTVIEVGVDSISMSYRRTNSTQTVVARVAA
jgi:transport and Golgi organization protein 2